MTRKALVSSRGDVDPEDEYNCLDNVVVKRRQQPKYSSHLRDAGPGMSSKFQSHVLEQAFEDGKYRGSKTSRKEMGLGQPDGHKDRSDLQNDPESLSELSVGDYSDVHSSEGEEEEEEDLAGELQQLDKEMEQMKRDEEGNIRVIKEQLVSDKKRGEHVKNQLKAWELLLGVEMAIHPLFQFIDKTKVSGTKTVAALTDLGRTLQKLAAFDMTEQDLSGVGRENLTKWHRQTLVGSGKKQLHSFNKDPWTLADEAWRTDSERLVKRARPSGSNYDDSDFHRVLLKEWINSQGRQGVAFRAINCAKRPTDNKLSKGRRLVHDPHPKLVSYMMPVPSLACWNDAKVDELVQSLFL